MSGKKNTGKKSASKKDSRKQLMLVISAVAIVAIVIIMYFIINGETKGSNTVEYGVPVDYEAGGYIKLGEYKNIAASVEVTDEDVAEEKEFALEDSESYEKVNGTAKEGDMVNIDYTCLLSGEAAEDYTSEDEYTVLGDEDYFPEFDTEIAGMNTGETKEITVEVPEDYGDELIDGQTVKFNVTLNYICGDEIEPELNDEFVSNYSDGECVSVADFDNYLRETLYNDNVESLADNIWEEVLENTELKKYHRGELKAATEETEKSYANFAEFSGESLDSILESLGMTEDDLDDVAKDAALEKMVAKTIAVKENITLSDEEYRNLLIEYMEYENGEEQTKTIEEMEADYETGYGENPKDAMLRENVKNHVKEWAQITGLK